VTSDRSRRRLHWTPDEERILRLEWKVVTPRTLRQKLPGRSWEAIRRKAQLLGLAGGQPQGTVTLKEAAKAAGYTVPHLRRILAWADVPVKKWGKRYTAVDLFDVEEAVAKWNACETLEQGAARLRIQIPHLRAALKYCEQFGEWYAGKRFDPSVLDDAVKRYDSRGESIREAAKRLGVSHSTLNRALWKAGMPRSPSGRGPKSWLAPGFAEEALRKYKAKSHKTQIES
jgi:transposase-like protein